MERTVAIRKLRKLLGKSLGYRVNSEAPTSEERAAAKIEYAAAAEIKSRIEQQKNERFRAILQADKEYQDLHAAYKAAKDRVTKLAGIVSAHKFTVGKTDSLFFHIKAEGDSWEEVIEKVSKDVRR